MPIPSGAVAGAAAGAMALAAILQDLAAGLPLPEADAGAVASTARRIAVVYAPRLTLRSEVAAVAGLLAVGVRSVARAARPRDAAPALYAAADAASVAYPTSASPALTRFYALARSLAAGVEAVALGEAFLAEARTEYADRRAATDARARVTAALDASTDRIAGALGPVVYARLAAVAREVSTHLARQAADLQPIVQVEAGRSYPSTAVAWTLYGDPARAPELVARNQVGTPLFMPARLEAVSPRA